MLGWLLWKQGTQKRHDISSCCRKVVLRRGSGVKVVPATRAPPTSRRWYWTRPWARTCGRTCSSVRGRWRWGQCEGQAARSTAWSPSTGWRSPPSAQLSSTRPAKQIQNTSCCTEQEAQQPETVKPFYGMSHCFRARTGNTTTQMSSKHTCWVKQFGWLRIQNGAACTSNVGSVVVVTHHPSRHHLPTSNTFHCLILNTLLEMKASLKVDAHVWVEDDLKFNGWCSAVGMRCMTNKCALSAWRPRAACRPSGNSHVITWHWPPRAGWPPRLADPPPVGWPPRAGLGWGGGSWQRRNLTTPSQLRHTRPEKRKNEKEYWTHQGALVLGFAVDVLHVLDASLGDVDRHRRSCRHQTGNHARHEVTEDPVTDVTWETEYRVGCPGNETRVRYLPSLR